MNNIIMDTSINTYFFHKLKTSKLARQNLPARRTKTEAEEAHSAGVPAIGGETPLFPINISFIILSYDVLNPIETPEQIKACFINFI
jgi:hypothetical protein